MKNTYTYDALHRVATAHEEYGNKNRSYEYDSLGNLTYETEQGNKSVDYKLNNLNQITGGENYNAFLSNQVGFFICFFSICITVLVKN